MRKMQNSTEFSCSAQYALLAHTVLNAFLIVIIKYLLYEMSNIIYIFARLISHDVQILRKNFIELIFSFLFKIPIKYFTLRHRALKLTVYFPSWNCYATNETNHYNSELT